MQRFPCDFCGRTEFQFRRTPNSRCDSANCKVQAPRRCLSTTYLGLSSKHMTVVHDAQKTRGQKHHAQPLGSGGDAVPTATHDFAFRLRRTGVTHSRCDGHVAHWKKTQLAVDQEAAVRSHKPRNTECRLAATFQNSTPHVLSRKSRCRTVRVRHKFAVPADARIFRTGYLGGMERYTYGTDKRRTID